MSDFLDDAFAPIILALSVVGGGVVAAIALFLAIGPVGLVAWATRGRLSKQLLWTVASAVAGILLQVGLLPRLSPSMLPQNLLPFKGAMWLTLLLLWGLGAAAAEKTRPSRTFWFTYVILLSTVLLTYWRTTLGEAHFTTTDPSPGTVAAAIKKKDYKTLTGNLSSATVSNKYPELGNLTPLEYAVQSKDLTLLNIILAHSNPTATKTLLLELASGNPDPKLTKAMLESLAPPGRQRLVDECLRRATRGEAAELFVKLGACGNSPGITLAVMAHPAVLKVVLSHGADPDQLGTGTDMNNSSALGMAAFSGQVETVKILLAHGAKPDLRPSGAHTPLQVACSREKVEVVRALLAAGADPNATYNQQNQFQGWTALHYLADSEGGNPEIARLLIKAGADPEKLTSYHKSAFGVASQASFARPKELMILLQTKKP